MSGSQMECACGTVEALASDRGSPIKHDDDLHEYNLVSGDGKIHYRMYFCFFCGGKLPESKRAGLFTEPSDQEMREVAELMSKAGSMQEVKQLLGEPDETAKAPKRTARQKAGLEYRAQHRYLKRWQTLDLTVRERKDGSVDSAFTGKYKGEPRGSAKNARRLA